ncbi:MAG: hypothetical protein PVJ84_06130 [Desulfobacteraceae bacterium]|jgi:hypothetical protein
MDSISVSGYDGISSLLAGMAMVLTTAIVIGCGGCNDSGSAVTEAGAVMNTAAYIPPECYAKTSDMTGRTYNSFYVCHSEGKLRNSTSDNDLQNG